MWCAVAEVAAPVKKEPQYKRTSSILSGDVDLSSSSDSEQAALDESDPNHSSDEYHSVFPPPPHACMQLMFISSDPAVCCYMPYIAKQGIRLHIRTEKVEATCAFHLANKEWVL